MKLDLQTFESKDSKSSAGSDRASGIPVWGRQVQIGTLSPWGLSHVCTQGSWLNLGVSSISVFIRRNIIVSLQQQMILVLHLHRCGSSPGSTTRTLTSWVGSAWTSSRTSGVQHFKSEQFSSPSRLRSFPTNVLDLNLPLRLSCLLPTLMTLSPMMWQNSGRWKYFWPEWIFIW